MFGYHNQITICPSNIYKSLELIDEIVLHKTLLDPVQLMK